jgi:predicted nucleic acid-binding protein
MKIYLDVCCLNRPFDDQTQDRIRLEAEAVLIILKYIELGKIVLINSDVIFYEISKIPNLERREKIFSLISKAKIYIKLDQGILNRAKEIQKLGIKSYDALHVACAERPKGDIFLTTDDRLLKKLQRNCSEIKTKVENPLNWIIEVIKNGSI